MSIKAQIVLAAAWLLSTPVQALESVYTPLGHKACKIDRLESKKLPPHEVELTPEFYPCAGIAGYRVAVIYHGTRVSFQMRPPGKANPFHLVTPYGTGDRLEWRGTTSAGNFAPTAVIVRLSEKIATDKVQSALVVIKLADGSPCIIGVVDTQANAHANVLAREAADSAATTECESSNTIRGIVTPYALELFDSNTKLRNH